MGCTSSSEGGIDKRPKIDSLRLQNIGMSSVDAFINQLNDVMFRFGQFTDRLAGKRRDIDLSSGFDWYKAYGTTMRHSIIGILLQYYALANGDMSKVKVETPAWRPYI
jgi:phenylalanyl-tRNA synthetase beta subunit